jgi:hypothetical protein
VCVCVCTNPHDPEGSLERRKDNYFLLFLFLLSLLLLLLLLQFRVLLNAGSVLNNQIL